MKKMVSIIMAGLMVAAFATAGFAGVYDAKCALCHKTDGKKGMAKASKDDLLKKFKTADEFVAGAKAATNPLMKSVQGDEKLLKDAAAEIGLK